MSNSQLPSALPEEDYQAIENAVMETERGRWFLAEYARRHRAADTLQVVDAIGRLEKLLHRERRPDIDRIRFDIAEMKDAIERTKAEIAEIKFEGVGGSRFNQASDELDAIVSQTESATSEILETAEKIQEIAWTLREAGSDVETCDALDTLTTTIYTACSFQDLTGQRTHKVVHVLRYLESRIDAMMAIWGLEEAEARGKATGGSGGGNPMDTRPDAHLLNGPQLAGLGVDQSFVDDMMTEAGPGGFAAHDAAGMADSIDFDAIESEDDDAASLADSLSFDAILPEEPSAEALADSLTFDAIAVEAEPADFDAIAPADVVAFANEDPADEAAIDEGDAETGAVASHEDEADAASAEAAEASGDDADLAAFIEDGLDDDVEAVAARDDADDAGEPDALSALSQGERFALFA
jgi:Chemotaxis protein